MFWLLMHNLVFVHILRAYLVIFLEHKHMYILRSFEAFKSLALVQKLFDETFLIIVIKCF